MYRGRRYAVSDGPRELVVAVLGIADRGGFTFSLRRSGPAWEAATNDGPRLDRLLAPPRADQLRRARWDAIDFSPTELRVTIRGIDERPGALRAPLALACDVAGWIEVSLT